MEVVSFKLYQRKLIFDDLSAMFYNSRGRDRMGLAGDRAWCVCVCVGGGGGVAGGTGGRETDRQRQTDRQTDRQRQTQRELH